MNTASNLTSYAGANIPSEVASLLSVLQAHGFTSSVTGHAQKTIRILRAGTNVGYVNSTVLQRKGVLGYHFEPHGHATDACPPEIEETLGQFISERYQVPTSALDVQRATRHTYLIFREPTAALQVLLRDANLVLPEGTQIVRAGQMYLEGRVVDVSLRRRERSPEARSACLAAYGFDCFVCGINLKTKYAGLPLEVVHVHHEEPLSDAESEREFDPVVTMKPVCPNCHAVIHSREPPYTVQEVQAMLAKHDV